MRTATFILSFAIVGLASCSAPRTLIQSSRTDSVGTVSYTHLRAHET